MKGNNNLEDMQDRFRDPPNIMLCFRRLQLLVHDWVSNEITRNMQTKKKQ